MKILDLFKLDGKKALVTGAGRGIGKAIATGLAEAGASVAIVDIDLETAKQTSDEIKKLGVESFAFKTDITKEDEVQILIDKVIAEFGTIDIVVNNAGTCFNIPAEEMTLEQWDNVINLNLRATFIVSQLAGREMIKRKQGVIVNVASMSATIVNYPQPQAAYNPSKSGVVMLTKCLATEWAKYNIRVNCISPGYTATEMTSRPVIKVFWPEWERGTPMGRLARPDEMRGAVVFLASNAASFITGHDLIIDGGFTNI
jgi:NAD(P)-dependent dehydrogenase (short-subunit alcohol dehydrogenase family)